jgi:hypothetical protein
MNIHIHFIILLNIFIYIYIYIYIYIHLYREFLLVGPQTYIGRRAIQSPVFTLKSMAIDVTQQVASIGIMFEAWETSQVLQLITNCLPTGSAGCLTYPH